MYTLDIERYENIIVARFHGDMTLDFAVEIRQHLERILKTSKIKDLVLDLDDVQHVDNSGVGALVGASTSARAWGKRLMLYRPTRSVMKILEHAEIYGFFPMLEDEHDLKARQLNKS